jgi:site-specific DNA-adenine methylase
MRLAPHYPDAKFDTIIEPFAGSASFSTYHYSKKVILVELDPVIAGIWDFLIHATPEDIINLPNTKEECTFPEGRNLIGFYYARASTHPRNKPSAHSRFSKFHGWSQYRKEKLARQVPHIKHWKIIHGSYEQLANKPATWFVDPPYSTPAGKKYKCNKVDYAALAKWCQERQGQVIVCEQANATWLPFRPFRTINNANQTNIGPQTSEEVIWTN